MKISILLPFKENYSSKYAGAVSLYVNESTRISKYKKNITIYGNTNLKNKFKNYFNLKLKEKKFTSKNFNYVKKFSEIEKKNKSDIIEIHNRPIYLKYLIEQKVSTNFVIFFHNDPLTIKGSENVQERIFLLENCTYIVFISNWLKKQFFKGISDKKYEYKILIIPHSAKKNIVNFSKKLNHIIFVGKLNSAKGYDLFGNAVIQILNKHKNWKAFVFGDEPREKLSFYHNRLYLKGFKSHDIVLNYYKLSKISVTCSRWEEPLGRAGIEASANGCAPIVSNRGGLPETITNGIILNNLNVKSLFSEIDNLIVKKEYLKKIQINSYKNFFLSHEKINGLIDNYRDKLNYKINLKLNTEKNLKILHITNFNQRHYGRLHYNTGKRINNGIIRLGHNVLTVSDRDITFFSKSFRDPSGSSSLRNHIINNFNNFKPDLLLLGHADRVSNEILSEIKNINRNIKIAQWFLDPLSSKGPDYKKNKSRILNNSDLIDNTFLTTHPGSLDFKINNSYFIPNPCDISFETLKNYNNDCYYDVFFAMSHGVHRGVLKEGKFDEREKIIKRIENKCPNLKFDIYGVGESQPIWGDSFLNVISNSKMGINLSRGKPIKYYSSDRIAQLTGNGLLTFIHKNTCYDDFFSNDEMIFYSNESDLIDKLNKYSKDNKLRKKVAKKGRDKYHKYFNSTIVSKYMINKTFEYKDKNNFYWDNN